MSKANKKVLVGIHNEQMRIVRTNIEQIDRKEVKTILLTSPSENSRQSVVAGSLAASFAETGKKVLLVDAKVYAPSLHTQHNVSNEEGLMEMLHGRKPLWHHTTVQGLFLMTAGRVTTMTRRAWTSVNLEYAAKKLLESFEVVIFNAPPYLETAEAKMLSEICHHHILVVTKNKTKTEQLIKIKTSLERSGKKLTGAIYEAG